MKKKFKDSKFGKFVNKVGQSGVVKNILAPALGGAIDSSPFTILANPIKKVFDKDGDGKLTGADIKLMQPKDFIYIAGGVAGLLALVKYGVIDFGQLIELLKVVIPGV